MPSHPNGTMKRIITPSAMQAEALALKRAGRRVALVPTMGALHDGHLSLVRRVRPRCDVLVVSLFVNPAQFGPGEDLERYPRDLEGDSRLCESEGVDILFCPSAEAMYPAGHSTRVEETVLSAGLCGRSRPGHFRGVATVVTKLFNIVQPDSAVFGQKDAQQVRVIQKLVEDLHLPVDIVIAPTVREPDGLALSSRNAYLSPAEKRRAPCLYRALQRAEALYAAGERDSATILEAVRGVMLSSDKSERSDRSDGTGVSVEIDYIELVDWDTLEPVESVTRPALLALAVRIGATRLIDNTALGGGITTEPRREKKKEEENHQNSSGSIPSEF